MEIVVIVCLSFFINVQIASSSESLYGQMCHSALLESQRLKGYNKFYDPVSCVHLSEPKRSQECDALKCRFCVNSDIAAHNPNINITQDTVVCPKYESPIQLTSAQESARQKVGISRHQMKMVLDSVKSCPSSITSSTTTKQSIIDKLHQLCVAEVSVGNSNEGSSLYYDPICPHGPGCNSGLSFANVKGSCRFCRVKGKECIGNCNKMWPECSNTVVAAEKSLTSEKHALLIHQNSKEDHRVVEIISTVAITSAVICLVLVVYVARTKKLRLKNNTKCVEDIGVDGKEQFSLDLDEESKCNLEEKSSE